MDHKQFYQYLFNLLPGKARRRSFLIALILLVPTILVFSDLCLSADGTDWNKAENLYIKQCSNCHRKNGTGIKRVYPPLKNSDYIRANSTEELLRGMLYGRSGILTVNGEKYNGVMTTEIDKSLTDNDIALILYFVYKNFNSIDKQVSVQDVKGARKAGKLPVKK